MNAKDRRIRRIENREEFAAMPQCIALPTLLTCDARRV
jgi:hypothetical protein